MNDSAERPYIFVSYAHEDAELVHREIEWLKGVGFEVWFDQGISPGSRWTDELATALHAHVLEGSVPSTFESGG